MRDLSLSVAAGETVALLGPSGCGKSTALRCIAGLEQPDAGQIEIGGREVTRLPPEARHVGLVFQDYALFPHLTVLGNVAYGPKVRGQPRAKAEAAAREALTLVGLSELEKRLPAQLSGGQQQRVALARALATASPLLLLDEPLSNLDEKLRGELRHDLGKLFGQVGAGVLLVTHDQREALALARRVAVMRAGQLVQVGLARSVFDAPATAWVAEFLGWPNIFSREGGRALLLSERDIKLGEGESLSVIARQPNEHGESVTVAHSHGPLHLHLSPREAETVSDHVRLSFAPQAWREVPDDR